MLLKGPTFPIFAPQIHLKPLYTPLCSYMLSTLHYSPSETSIGPSMAPLLFYTFIYTPLRPFFSPFCSCTFPDDFRVPGISVEDPSGV